MAAVTLSSFINVTPRKLFHSSRKLSANFGLKHQEQHLPRITVCHGKLNSSRGDEYGEIDEGFFDGDEMIEEESDDDDDDDSESSIDLLFKFIHSMFKKVSKRAKKASRSVLPVAMSPQLVSFAVDGVLLLASLSILKAFLEVVCTLGATVFVVILLLRMIWATIAYFQSNGYGFNQGGTTSFGPSQPA